MKNREKPSYLVVNADDYAYFPGVSRGIIDAHTDGIVTATGVLANGSSFSADASKLRSTSSLDAGVHLNLTFGQPLTANMQGRFGERSLKFESKGKFASQYVLRRIILRDVESEWRAQIEKCQGANLKLWFLNSHEHVHLIPSLFKLTQELAREYEIPYIRLPSATIFESMHPVGIIRAGIVKFLSNINGKNLRSPSINFVGFGQSGRLSRDYLAQIVRGLKPGTVYELMCHPGYGDEIQPEFEYLRAYHDWSREMQTLTDPVIRAICEEENVRIIGFRDIENVSA